jgi:hypothetical protein
MDSDRTLVFHPEHALGVGENAHLAVAKEAATPGCGPRRGSKIKPHSPFNSV